MYSKLLQFGLMNLWATIIVLAMISASKAEDKGDRAERSALSSPVATSFDSCMEVYIKSLRGPVDFRFITFCGRLNRGIK